MFFPLVCCGNFITVMLVKGPFSFSPPKGLGLQHLEKLNDLHFANLNFLCFHLRRIFGLLVLHSLSWLRCNLPTMTCTL